MKSLTLEEAADFLKMNAEVLRSKAKAGKIPGGKPGKCWVFIKEHLADFVSGRDNSHGRLLRVIDGGKSCQSLNEQTVKTGLSKSRYQTVSEYNKVLGRTTNSKPKNCTTR
ncbi:MAG: helix-turn-helix domain-containing protein [Methylococcales bacterium]|nr:helix-turn-helix domain-containing protein [Methylococcales bacterium]